MKVGEASRMCTSLNDVHILTRHSKMKLFPGKFLQCIPVCTKHLKTAVHLLILTSVMLYLLDLPTRLDLRTYPKEDGIAFSQCPCIDEYGRGYDHEPCELTVRALEQVPYLFQKHADIDFRIKN